MKSKNSIEKLLYHNNYSLIEININNNSINGIIIKDNVKYFFKCLGVNLATAELNGHRILEKSSIFDVPMIVEVIKNKNIVIIVFEYEKSISNNSGLLNDYFVLNKGKDLHKILNTYKNAYSSFIISKDYPMAMFFSDRIENRILKWYGDSKYDIKINKQLSVKAIIDEVNNYFSVEHYYKCYITQGDPNCLNICINGTFLDYMTSGYNPVEAELSSLFWSVIFNDCYFAPKYNASSFIHHERIIETYKHFLPYIDFDYDNNIFCLPLTTTKRKKFLLQYINILKEKGIIISQEIKYFFAMRILGIFNINNMEQDDYYYILYLLDFIYNGIGEDVYTSLFDILEKVGVVDECIF